MTIKQINYLTILLIVLNTACGIWECTDYLGFHNYYLAAFNFVVAAILILGISKEEKTV